MLSNARIREISAVDPVRQLNNQITAERNVRFWRLRLLSLRRVLDMHNSREFQMEWLRTQGDLKWWSTVW